MKVKSRIVRRAPQRTTGRQKPVIAPPRRPGIRVEPRDEKMRRILKHPSGMRFRSTGSVEWPDDIFTHKRLAEGSIKLATKPEDKKPEKKQDDKKSEARSSD